MIQTCHQISENQISLTVIGHTDLVTASHLPILYPTAVITKNRRRDTRRLYPARIFQKRDRGN